MGAGMNDNRSMAGAGQLGAEVMSSSDGSGNMFDRIARRYDMLNRLMSMGLDSRWRSKLVGSLHCSGRARVLDVATGTADVAIAVCSKFSHVKVTGLDPSGRMLAIGREKVRLAGFDDRIDLVTGDAQAMPFESATFNATCVSFGIRNVPDRLQGLREMVRVTKPGGRVAVLELGEPRDGAMRRLARFHVHQVVPRLGAILSGEPEYRYLAKSIAAFPPPDEFVSQLETAGLHAVDCHRLSFGAVYLYWGTV